MNAMKQAKINGGASSQVPTFRFPIMDEPPLQMQRTPEPYFMNGQSERPWKRFAYSSPLEELDYDRSVVPMEKPLGKMEIEAMIEAAVEQTNTGRKNDSRIFADIQM
jgi:hypothetical protein